LDCDHDALRILVVPAGVACHTGAQTCFHNELPSDSQDGVRSEAKPADLEEVLNCLYRLIELRHRERPAGSYTTYLFDQGLDKILKKVGEECAETIIAAKNDDRSALIKETSDLLYHLLVLFVDRGLTLDEVRDELLSRNGREVNDPGQRELKHLLDFAVQLAREAGDIADRHFKGSFVAERKADNSLVTIADRKPREICAPTSSVPFPVMHSRGRGRREDCHKRKALDYRSRRWNLLFCSRRSALCGPHWFGD